MRRTPSFQAGPSPNTLNVEDDLDESLAYGVGPTTKEAAGKEDDAKCSQCPHCSSTRVPLDSLRTLDVDVVAKERNYYAESWSKQNVPFLEAVQAPQVMSVLIAGAFIAIAVAIARGNAADSLSNATLGFIVSISVFLVFCVFQLRDSVVLRPHPIFWRLIKGIGLLYMLGLIFILFQNVDDVRSGLRLYDPNLGQPLPEQDYAADCRIFTPEHEVSSFANVSDALFDTFVLCHLIGWFCKYLMLRDIWLTLACSVSFELLELSFKHILENFNECWWDQVVLDLIVCNGLGIWCGYFVQQLFHIKAYNWVQKRIKVVDSNTGVTTYKREWLFLRSFRNLTAVVWIMFVLSVIELNAFFLKTILWTPPPHSLNFWRVVFWWLLGVAGTREYYEWYSNPEKVTQFGFMTVLIFVNAALESLVALKMGQGMFTAPAPLMVKVAWCVALAAFLLFCSIYFPLKAQREAAAKKQLGAGDDDDEVVTKPDKQRQQVQLQRKHTNRMVDESDSASHASSLDDSVTL